MTSDDRNPAALYALKHPNVRPHDGERMPTLVEIIAAVRAVKRDFQLSSRSKQAPKIPFVRGPEAVGSRPGRIARRNSSSSGACGL
jgi:hypothetical protein